MSKKTRTKLFNRRMNKSVQKRVEELYNDTDFRLQLEKETEQLDTIEKINKYQDKAGKLSRDEIKR